MTRIENSVTTSLDTVIVVMAVRRSEWVTRDYTKIAKIRLTDDPRLSTPPDEGLVRWLLVNHVMQSLSLSL